MGKYTFLGYYSCESEDPQKILLLAERSTKYDSSVSCLPHNPRLTNDLAELLAPLTEKG